MIIFKIIILYFIQIRHTDAISSKGPRLVPIIVTIILPFYLVPPIHVHLLMIIMILFSRGLALQHYHTIQLLFLFLSYSA